MSAANINNRPQVRAQAQNVRRTAMRSAPNPSNSRIAARKAEIEANNARLIEAQALQALQPPPPPQPRPRNIGDRIDFMA